MSLVYSNWVYFWVSYRKIRLDILESQFKYVEQIIESFSDNVNMSYNKSNNPKISLDEFIQGKLKNAKKFQEEHQEMYNYLKKWQSIATKTYNIVKNQPEIFSDQ